MQLMAYMCVTWDSSAAILWPLYRLVCVSWLRIGLLWEQSFTAHMLTAIGIFRLGTRQ